MVSSAEVVIFGGFRRLVASFRVAGVALRDIQRCFVTCRKSFCVAGAILLRRFQKMCCSFRGRRSTLDVSIVIFRGRRSTLDVSRCVFFANRIGRAASSGDKVQIPWQAWHFVTCAENWRKPRMKHRFWGCKIIGKLVGKRRFWSYKVWKLEKVSHEMLVLVLPRVSSRVSGFPVASPCLWGKLQNLLLSCCQLWKLPEVSYEMLVFLHPRVLSRVAGFPVASPCLWGKLENLSYSNVSKQVVMSFCMAGVAPGDIPTCLIMCRKCQNWRKSRTKCSFFCTLASRLESLVFLWRRRVYGGSWKTSPVRMCPSRLSCRFACQAWHFVTFQPAW